MPDSPKEHSTPNLNKTQQQELLAENERLKAQLAAKEAAEREAREQKIGFTKWLLGRWIGESVRKHAHQVRKELPTPSTEAITDLFASIFIRLTQIGPIAILLAILPLSILSIQTCMLYQQNQKIETQNEKIDKQVYLEEASRRNSLVFLMDNILNQANVELNDKDNRDSVLSTPLIGRIQALAQGFQPYRFLEGDSLTRPLSPERGQFLLALASSGIGKATLRKIYKKAPFQYAYLSNAKMDSLYLDGVDLSDTDLREADLRKADLRKADLREADLREADLREAVLSDVYLRKADLRKADLSDADLSKAYLFNADLRKADLSDADLSKAYLFNADLFNADLREADLRKADLRYAELREADLREANLFNADLRYADLRYADLRYADLRYADLSGAKVYQENWLEQLTEWEVSGHEDIQSEYQLISSKSSWGQDCFELQLKNPQSP